MTPGAPTTTERNDDLRAVAFRNANPRQPEDPDLRFVVDIGLKRRPVEGRAS